MISSKKLLNTPAPCAARALATNIRCRRIAKVYPVVETLVASSEINLSRSDILVANSDISKDGLHLRTVTLARLFFGTIGLDVPKFQDNGIFSRVDLIG